MSLFNPFSLEGKNFLITGAASGIGRATSIILTKLGARLIIVDINESGLLETNNYCNNSNTPLMIDLVKTSSIEANVLRIIPDFGKLHGFVHLAGKPYISPLKTINKEKIDEIYNLNSYAALQLAKIFTNRKVYAGEKGSIIFISSVYAIVGSAANVGYAMSKSALHGITKALSIELAPKGIRVNCVAPGFVKTSILPNATDLFGNDHNALLNTLHPLGLGEPDDIAYAIAYLLSDASKWVTGSIFNIDGGFTAR